jgi:hypothetical protein
VALSLFSSCLPDYFLSPSRVPFIYSCHHVLQWFLPSSVHGGSQIYISRWDDFTATTIAKKDVLRLLPFLLPVTYEVGDIISHFMTTCLWVFAHAGSYAWDVLLLTSLALLFIWFTF